jgi:hypothetical protein
MAPREFDQTLLSHYTFSNLIIPHLNVEEIQIMSLGTKSIRHRRPNHVMSADGEPEAVLIDFPTWKMILAYLEDVVDNQIVC